MSHPRETIRKTVRDILVNGNTEAGNNIFMNKMNHPDDTCLPVVIIYTESESIELMDQAPKRQKRTMLLQLEVMTQRPKEDDNNDLLDQLTLQIEKLLADDDDWNQTVNDQNLVSLRFEFRENGRVPIAACLMGYEVEYLTEYPEDVATQRAANLTDLDAVQGFKSQTGGQDFGWDLVGIPGAVENQIEAELLIDYTT